MIRTFKLYKTSCILIFMREPELIEITDEEALFIKRVETILPSTVRLTGRIGGELALRLLCRMKVRKLFKDQAQRHLEELTDS
jgi:hypothetical protein